ncbi:MAG: PaaX family transcriptional regulator C-terminal domain-containing protein, partial [Streptosporangiaceae bacterium]
GAGRLSLVRQAWDLEEIERTYDTFLADFAQQPCGDPLARLIQLVHAWRRFPFIDPALPLGLLPDRWNGGQAALLFQRQRATWTPGAKAEWARLAHE